MKLTEPEFDEAEIANLRSCLSSGWVTQGPFVTQFEAQVRTRHNVKHGFAVTSCTAGLHLAALALGLGPGDEILVPAFTWITSANMAEYVGAEVVFVDVDPTTFNIDPEAAAAAVTDKTKAIVAVHLFGLAADMNPILQLASAHELIVIEDAACALGTHYQGKPVGGIGDIASFSFHPRKAVTTGEGGLVSTNDDELAAKVAALRNHGSIGTPEGTEQRQPWTMAQFAYAGLNYRMSDIQAAVGVAQMEKFDSILARRVERAKRYLTLLAPFEGEIQLPHDPEESGSHSYQSFVVRMLKGGREKRNALMQFMAKRDLETRPGTHAVHRLDYYANKYGLKPDDYPNAAICEDTTVTIPLSPLMTDADQDLVVSAIGDFLSG